MKLIGMLDSPFVRRVAISLLRWDMPFEHQSLSVFSTYDQFKQINPLVKAPTLVLDNGEWLIESTLILDYLETRAAEAGLSSLMPAGLDARARALRTTGLALAACEKTMQIVYERNLRPAEKQHLPWISRVTEQLHAAYETLEKAVDDHPLGVGAQTGTQTGTASEPLMQDGITTAVAWRFTQHMLGDTVPGFDLQDYPVLTAFTATVEKLDAFVKTPLV